MFPTSDRDRRAGGGDAFGYSEIAQGPMEHPPQPTEYYRRHAARVRDLARQATTPAVKQRLREAAQEYERLAERVEESGSGADEATRGT